jgi:hypothetical protein
LASAFCLPHLERVHRDQSPIARALRGRSILVKMDAIASLPNHASHPLQRQPPHHVQHAVHFHFGFHTTPQRHARSLRINDSSRAPALDPVIAIHQINNDVEHLVLMMASFHVPPILWSRTCTSRLASIPPPPRSRRRAWRTEESWCARMAPLPPSTKTLSPGWTCVSRAPISWRPDCSPVDHTIRPGRCCGTLFREARLDHAIRSQSASAHGLGLVTIIERRRRSLQSGIGSPGRDTPRQSHYFHYLCGL